MGWTVSLKVHLVNSPHVIIDCQGISLLFVYYLEIGFRHNRIYHTVSNASATSLLLA